jgi:hypothetical protein
MGIKAGVERLALWECAPRQRTFDRLSDRLLPNKSTSELCLEALTQGHAACHRAGR